MKWLLQVAKWLIECIEWALVSGQMIGTNSVWASKTKGLGVSEVPLCLCPHTSISDGWLHCKQLMLTFSIHDSFQKPIESFAIPQIFFFELFWTRKELKIPVIDTNPVEPRKFRKLYQRRYLLDLVFNKTNAYLMSSNFADISWRSCCFKGLSFRNRENQLSISIILYSLGWAGLIFISELR